MSDRADTIAKQVVCDAWEAWPGDCTSTAPSEPANVIEHMTVRFAAALRAYAEEVRLEERDVAAKDAEMRYGDGYMCGVADEREALTLWAKGRCWHGEVMTPPTDSLVAALRAALDAVDVVVCIRGLPEMCPCCRARASAEGRASIPALAAAVRGWMTTQMPPRATGHTGTFVFADAYNECLDDVAGRLGL